MEAKGFIKPEKECSKEERSETWSLFFSSIFYTCFKKFPRGIFRQNIREIYMRYNERKTKMKTLIIDLFHKLFWMILLGNSDRKLQEVDRQCKRDLIGDF